MKRIWTEESALRFIEHHGTTKKIKQAKSLIKFFILFRGLMGLSLETVYIKAGSLGLTGLGAFDYLRNKHNSKIKFVPEHVFNVLS